MTEPGTSLGLCTRVLPRPPAFGVEFHLRQEGRLADRHLRAQRWGLGQWQGCREGEGMNEALGLNVEVTYHLREEVRSQPAAIGKEEENQESTCMY